MHRVRDRIGKKDRSAHKLRNVPPAFMLEETRLIKYWNNRFELFSRFDEGIRLDRESWFSVTPECVAKYQARRLACDVLIDGFCGSGGNAIQFAKTCGRVIAIDIDPLKVEMAKHNARIYGVADRIEFIVGDFLHMCRDDSLPHADVVFLSPPWGGPEYNRCKQFDIERFLQPVGATALMREARRISENVALYLPRNSDRKQLLKLTNSASEPCEVHTNFVGNKTVAITVFYGDKILDKNSEHLFFDEAATEHAPADASQLNFALTSNSTLVSNSSLSSNDSSSVNNAAQFSNNWQNYSNSNNLSIFSNSNICANVADIYNACGQCSLM